jgi:uncharacterized protein YdhG (YjbR/CyaY superfamily)
MSVIDDYLAGISPTDAMALEHVRTVIHSHVPDHTTETIGYGMPVIKYKGAYLLGFSAFKDHLSIFPGGEAIGQFAERLTDYKTAKGTIQFTAAHPLPDELLRDIIDVCLAAIEARLP